MITLRILVVDDEQGMRMGITRALRRFSTTMPGTNEEITFELDEAASGEEALEKIDACQPDLLLLDMKLPGIDGLEVLEEIANRKLNISTIMITAYASIKAAVTATKRGAFDFLPKPFTPDELKNAIRKDAQHVVLAERARKLAEERNKIRFNFISVLAHELKAPINAIEGYLEILGNPTLMEKMDKAAYNRMIDRSVYRIGYMRKMILDLLDLTRIESGEKKRNIESVDIREIAECALDAVRNEAERRNITLSIEAPESLIMMADASEIEIIFNNLISNAVKYNTDNGTVRVLLKKMDEYVEIHVSDTGIGMTKEEAGRLFGEFSRIKNAKTRNISGTGLGLSILKKLAIAYGGDVSVDSVPDEGSTFHVKISDLQVDESKEKPDDESPMTV